MTHTQSPPFTVALTDFSDTDGAYSSEVFTITINGDTTLKYEEWHTHNADGADFFTEDGDTVDIPTAPGIRESEEEALGEAISDLTQKFQAVYCRLWRERVQPVLEQIKQEALATVNGQPEQEG